MKKQILAVTCAMLSTCALNAHPSNIFSWLAPAIEKSQQNWIAQSEKSLVREKLIVCLNFFGLSFIATEDTSELLSNCFRYISQEQTLVTEFIEPINAMALEFIEEFTNVAKAKFQAHKKYPTQEETQVFEEALQQKQIELFLYFIVLFYKNLYSHLAESGTEDLTIAFDNNGLIAPESRTQELPSPF
jgi:hypothetical protein